MTGPLIYEDKRAQLPHRGRSGAADEPPDIIVLGGYVPDTSVVLKDLYRAGFGEKIGYSFGVNQVLADGVPHEVSEGTASLGAVGVRRFNCLQDAHRQDGTVGHR